MGERNERKRNVFVVVGNFTSCMWGGMNCFFGMGFIRHICTYTMNLNLSIQLISYTGNKTLQTVIADSLNWWKLTHEINTTGEMWCNSHTHTHTRCCFRWFFFIAIEEEKIHARKKEIVDKWNIFNLHTHITNIFFIFEVNKLVSYIARVRIPYSIYLKEEKKMTRKRKN